MIRPSALGDVARTVPALSALRAANPRARIDWLVQDTFTDVVRAHPALTRVIPFARRGLSAALLRGDTRPVRHLLRELRAARYDLVYDLQGLARSGFLAFATRAARRIGFRNAREFGWLGLNERHRIPASLHSVDRMLEIVRASGAPCDTADMRLYTPPDAIASLERDDVFRPILDENYIVLAPTSRWAAKQWPPDRFAECVAQLLDGSGTRRVVIVGAEGERHQIEPLLELARRDSRLVDLVGRTSIGQMMAIIERARLVIANDSAALHIAVGFDRPIVALYGPTRVDLVGPYRHESDVIQHVAGEAVDGAAADSLDHKNTANRVLMERITVAEVVDAANKRLRSGGSGVG